MASSEEPAPVTPGMARRLAAILSADVVGYSRLMSEDEEATVRTVTVYRGVIAALVEQHRGRVVDSQGDNLLAEFASVLDAVQCAVAIQRDLNARNAALPLSRRMQFRLGINLGDVIPDGERIYGDGVNIAARLEGLAEAGGICVSGTVYDQVATKLPLTYKFVGRQAVKNIARPVRAYWIQAGSGPADRKGRLWDRRGVGPRSRMALALVGLLLILGGGMVGWRLSLHLSRPTAGDAARALPDKPSIAVLPFINLSDDPEQEYFSDGMTEDLITELSGLSGLFVIARNSVFTYKGKPAKPDQVNRELGVQYIIEGSVRKANNRMRITAQLVNATTGYHMWAQYYDRDVHDIFAVQEEIARRITRALAVRLTREEEKHMGQPYTSNQDAWDEFMRGAEFYRRFTKEANAHARERFEKAINLDPEFARAYANLAATYRQDWTFAWTQGKERATSMDLAYSKAQKAVELARREPKPQPSLPYALEQLGYVLLYRGQHQEAINAATEAVQVNSNFADGYALWAHVLIYLGKPQDALDKTAKAIAFETAKAEGADQQYPFFYDYHRGQAYYVWGFQTEGTADSKGYYENAKTYLQQALDKNKNFRSALAYLVAVLVALDQPDEAKRQMTVLVRDLGRQRIAQNPEFETYVRETHPYENRHIMDRLIEVWMTAEKE